MTEVPRPQAGDPSRTAIAEHLFVSSAAELYDAFTTGFDRWFAQPGTLSMQLQEGSAWFFYNRDDWGRHPHYGRFLCLDPGRLVETTWVTGNGTDEGTMGAETVLKVEMMPLGETTLLRLTHSGFVSDASRDAHAENWPLALDELAAALKRGLPPAPR